MATFCAALWLTFTLPLTPGPENDLGDRFPGDWLYLFVAIDRTSKFAVVRLYDEATRRTSVQFLEKVLIVVPELCMNLGDGN